ncbi:unnamed protein product, partial [Choristocarpus tenellus]
MHAYAGALDEMREEADLPFETWTLEQMKEFVVRQNLEVRGSARLEHSHYVAIMDKLFQGCSEFPDPPEPLTEEFKARREAAAKRLQDVWFNRKRARWNILKVNANPDGHLAANPLLSPRGVMAAAERGRVDEFTPWQKPDEAVAVAFRDSIHPRDPTGEKFNLKASTTGRYCTLGGCGEQLDLWDEGQISEFAPYGAGVTSYFKFLKFCAWSFFVISFGVLPHIFINVAADAIEASTSTDILSLSTIGNLGSSLN